MSMEHVLILLPFVFLLLLFEFFFCFMCVCVCVCVTKSVQSQEHIGAFALWPQSWARDNGEKKISINHLYMVHTLYVCGGFVSDFHLCTFCLPSCSTHCSLCILSVDCMVFFSFVQKFSFRLNEITCMRINDVLNEHRKFPLENSKKKQREWCWCDARSKPATGPKFIPLLLKIYFWWTAPRTWNRDTTRIFYYIFHFTHWSISFFIYLAFHVLLALGFWNSFSFVFFSFLSENQTKYANNGIHSALDSFNWCRTHASTQRSVYFCLLIGMHVFFPLAYLISSVKC